MRRWCGLSVPAGVAALLGGAGCVLTAQEVSPAAVDAQSSRLDSVFETRRLPDVDLVILKDGHRLTGTLKNDLLRLQTPHGELTFPWRLAAGVELSDGRGALDVLVTVNRNRFSGFLIERSFRFETESDGGETALHSRKVHRLVLRRREDEIRGLAAGLRVVLRSGDFFTGTLVDDRIRLEGATAEATWSSGEIISVTFPRVDLTSCRVRMRDGSVVSGEPVTEELEFQLDLGPRLRLYAGWIEEIQLPGEWPAPLLRRLGGGGTSTTSPPGPADSDPAVVPVAGMVRIPMGDFVMGSPDDERDRDFDEGPLTQVVFPVGFWMGRCEVTQAEFETLMGTNLSLHLGDPARPMERVSWQEAAEYTRRLTERERAAGHLPEGYAYRLPTEAEWEYACRAGTSTRFSFGDDVGEALVGDYAWFDRNSGSATHPVGTKQANAWRLHDMHGNVLEWCLNAWQGSLPGGRVTNLAVLPEGTLRTARGGSWLYPARFCRSANRDSYGLLNRCSDVGFRVVLAPR